MTNFKNEPIIRNVILYLNDYCCDKQCCWNWCSVWWSYLSWYNDDGREEDQYGWGSQRCQELSSHITRSLGIFLRRLSRQWWVTFLMRCAITQNVEVKGTIGERKMSWTNRTYFIFFLSLTFTRMIIHFSFN